MKSLYVLFIMLMATIEVGFSQQPEVFEKMAKASNLIVEGEVVSVRSYWSDDNTEINTENIIRVNKVYTGQLVSENITIITRGGIIDDNQFQFLMHYTNLHKDLYGLFFVDQIIDKEDIYQLHYSDCGFLEIYSKKFRPYFSHPVTGEVFYKQAINQLLLITRDLTGK